MLGTFPPPDRSGCPYRGLAGAGRSLSHQPSSHMKIKTCPDCNGDGVIDKDTDNERQCPTCGGVGFVPDDDDDGEVIKTLRL